MPRQIALLVYLSLIAFLLWCDRGKKNVSRAIWVPQLWMLIAGSRFLSQWLNIIGIHVKYSQSVTEGSPVDRTFFLILIIFALIILSHRKVDWHKFFAENSFVWLFFLYGAVSIIWSDYPFVSFKRWVKACGNLVMALLILTERKPYVAFGVILRRTAFILLPLSILFIKYYPELGRSYHMGKPMFHGVSTQKNGLGELCLICGIYFVWDLIFNGRMDLHSDRHKKIILYTTSLGMISWLLYKANSATSLACMFVALAFLIFAAHPAITNRPGRLLGFSIGSGMLFAALDALFSIRYTIINMLGRRPDLTTRVPMWQDLLSMAKHPITGFGFESFWLGARREYMAEHWKITIQAHNGYLEMYLNLGIIGVLFVLAWIITGLRKVQRCLPIDYPAGVLRLCIILVVVLYNWTEATFYGINNMWLLFFIALIDPPNLALARPHLNQKQ